VFREGRTYALTASGANGVASRFSESEGEWTEPPERVMACDEDKSYVVVTSSAEGAANQRFDVNDVEELDQRACCLVGAWKPTEEALFETARMQNQIAATIPVPDASVSCNYTGGDWSVSFTAGGDGALEWNEFANECVAALPRGQRTTSGVWNGALDFSWAILDERDPSRPELIGANATYTDNTATNTVTTKVGPMSTRPRIIPLSAPSDGNFAYQCSETELTLYGFYGLHPDARHLRAGGSR
jgi:subtilisin family serine protease